MDWFSVAKVIAPLAPVLGSVLGGLIPFPGAGLAGQAIGSVIARQFGVPDTPEAVTAALKNSPNEVVLAKLNAATEEAKAMWPALAQMETAWAQAMGVAATQVNLTMQQELLNPHWFFTGWRPTAGWLFNLFALQYGTILTIAVLMAAKGNDALLKAAAEAQTLAAGVLIALAAIVGVYIIGRSHEKAKLVEAVTAVPLPPTKPSKK